MDKETQMEYWKDGTRIIEKCLAASIKADPHDAPMPLDHKEAELWHLAQMNAYRHALEMMGFPESWKEG